MNLMVKPESLLNDLKKVIQSVHPKSLTLHTNVGMLGVIEGPFKKGWQLSEYERIIGMAFTGVCLRYPTFNYDFLRNGIYNVLSDPCKVGSLNEYIRKEHPESRTHTPVFNFCILGNHSYPLKTISENPFARNSIFSGFVENDSWIGFLGAGFNANTFIHYVEEEANIGYRYIKVFKGKVLVEGSERPVSLHYRVRPLQEGAVDYNWGRLEQELLRNGILKVFPVGLGKFLLVEGERLYEYWLDNLKKDEWYFLTDRSKTILSEISKRNGYPFSFDRMENPSV